MKVSQQGRDAIRDHIRRELENAEKDSSIGRDALTHMLSYWVIGLLENHNKPELARELFEEDGHG